MKMTAVSPLTLDGRLQAAAHAPTGVVFVDRNEREEFHSYRDLADGAQDAYAMLRARSIAPGDRVAIILPTSPAFYHALFGCLRAGAIAVPLYPPTRLGKMEEYDARTQAMLRACHAKLVVTSAPLAPLLRKAIHGAQVAGGVVSLPARQSALNVQPFVPTNGTEHSVDDIALLQFSSGTTGAPKAVALRHRQVTANVEAIVHHINTQVPLPAAAKKHTVVSWLPLYHDMGLMGCVLGALFDQTTLVLLPPEAFVARPALWLRAISRHRASVSAAPNFAYSLAAERVSDEDMCGLDLSTWHLALNGAEGVSAASMQSFASRFRSCGFLEKALTPVYGLAEATLAVAFSSPAARYKTTTVRSGQATEDLSLVSVGRPLPGLCVEIQDDAGAPVADGTIGQVAIDGPSVCDGYWQQQGDHVAPRAPGWLQTGDLGVFVAGELHIVGRQKDVLIINGKNHSPERVEAAAQEVEGIRRGCVVAIATRPADAATDVVVVLAETYSRQQTERAQMKAAIVRRVAADAQLRVYEVVLVRPGTLPRTSSGKLRRQAARAQWQEGALAAPKRFVKARLWWRYRLAQLQTAFGGRSTP